MSRFNVSIDTCFHHCSVHTFEHSWWRHLNTRKPKRKPTE